MDARGRKTSKISGSLKYNPSSTSAVQIHDFQKFGIHRTLNVMELLEGELLNR